MAGSGYSCENEFKAAEWQKNENPLKADLIDDNRIDEQDLAAFCQQWLNTTDRE